jgi:radical SAM superfamily enzyme YgiQ (UPF0313 family)
MKALTNEVKNLGIKPEQVQDFTPTPMTLSTLIYYTGADPFTGKKVYVAKHPEDKRRQKEYFFWYQKNAGHRSDFVKPKLLNDRIGNGVKRQK